jgi:hypothetical protein
MAAIRRGADLTSDIGAACADHLRLPPVLAGTPFERDIGLWRAKRNAAVKVKWCAFGSRAKLAKTSSGEAKVANLGFQIARRMVVFQQDLVLERLMPALDLALCLRMAGRAHVTHIAFVQPFSQVSRDIGTAIVRQQSRTMSDIN